MISLRPAKERGHTRLDWLESYHTFSFDTYFDPKYHNFRSLRVINEDIVKPGGGFHPHSHRDMEIITYVLEGALEHQDSLGNGSVIKPGEVQKMSAGIGVTHSEFNASKKESVHLLQIWIAPSERGLKPGYEQKKFPLEARHNRLSRLPVTIHQDAVVYASVLDRGKKVSHSLQSGRGVWIQMVRGEIEVNGSILKAGDGASLTEEKSFEIKAERDSEFLLFDLQ